MRFLMWMIVIFSCIGGYYSFVVSNELGARAVREVRMIDAWPYNSCYKSKCTEYWKGYFVDVKSDKRFEYETSGGLYLRFAKDHKPVSTSINLDPKYWDDGLATKSAWYFVLGALLIVAAIVAAVLSAIQPWKDAWRDAEHYDFH